MTAWHTTSLTGWGRTSAATVPTARPERMAALHHALAQGGAVLAHGLGRSYGDVAVPVEQSRALLLTQLDRFLTFDDSTGLLVCEAGVPLIDIQNNFLPKGWALPVTPGTGFVTLGGAIANDVHGKNHLIAGSLGHHIEWIDVLLPSGEERRLSRTAHETVFRATLGGLGLTGIILRVAIHLMAVAGQAMAVTTHRAPDLEALFNAFETLPTEDDHAVAWLDTHATGKRMGRGIFERAHFVAAKVKPAKPGLNMPMDFPNFALNPLTIGAFNKFHYNFGASGKPQTHLMAAQKFFYPLDSIGSWNRMYGKRGFHQFQAIIPREAAVVGVRKLLDAISASHRSSFLAVLKRLGDAGEGMLSFPMPGYTLALDFPNAPGVEDFIRTLIRTTRDHGGRVYLAKDSMITADDFAAMYPQHRQFQDVCHEVDPEGRLTSRMAVRLGLRRAMS